MILHDGFSLVGFDMSAYLQVYDHVTVIFTQSKHFFLCTNQLISVTMFFRSLNGIFGDQ